MPSLPALLLAVLLTAACTPDMQPSPVPPTEQAGQCGAPRLQRLVGQPATVLETMRFGSQVRIIRPGMAVTMDYSPDRLNIEIDGAQRIISVACG